MGLFDFFTSNKNEKILDFITRGAVIIDVRTESEFETGSIPGSKNIPLQVIASKVERIKRLKKPIILCCRSGMRSETATSILSNHGIEAMNGGGWLSLSKKV